MAAQQTGMNAEAEAARAWANGISDGLTALGGAWRPGRGTSWAVWQEELAVFEVLQPRGNCMRSMGSVWRGKTMLHAEEGLWLAERGMLAVHPPSRSEESDTDEISLAARSGRGGGGGSGTVASVTTGAKEAPVLSPSFSKTLTLSSKVTTGPRFQQPAVFSAPATNSITVEDSATTGKAGTISEAENRIVSLNSEFRIVEEKGVRGARARARAGGHRGAAPSISVEALHGVLSRAGVPWECYRAYAELRRRSFVVRRRPEDTIGQDDKAPRAPSLSWFGEPPNAKRCAVAEATAGDGSHLFLPVTFHVYAPNAAFQRREPGPPDFWLAVCRYGDPMPSHDELIYLAERHAEVWGARKDNKAGQAPGQGDGIRVYDGGGGGQEICLSQFGEASRGDPSWKRGSKGFRSDGEELRLSGDAVGTQGARVEEKQREPGKKRNFKRERGAQGLKVAVVSGDGSVHIFDVGIHAL